MGIFHLCDVSKLKSFYTHLLYQIYEDLVQLLKPKLISLYVIGSIAKDEPSCFRIKNGNDKEALFISDLDLIVLVDLVSFVKCKLMHCDRIGTLYTKALRFLNIETHVSMTVTSLKLYRVLKFLKLNTINLYEMKKVLCYKPLKICGVAKRRKELSMTIDVDDVLDLVVSSIADYLYVITNDVNETKALYTIIKRILSLFYALDLALGFRPQSFAEAPLIVMNNLEKMHRFVDENDLELLQTIATCRKHSDLQCLLQVMKTSCSERVCEGQSFLLNSLYTIFEKYAVRILWYLIKIKTSHTMHKHPIDRSEVVAVAEIYKQLRKPNFAQTFITLIDLLNSLLVRKHKRDLALKVYTLFKRELTLYDFLRYLILKFFALILLKGRDEVLRSQRLKKVGSFIANLWYRYML